MNRGFARLRSSSAARHLVAALRVLALAGVLAAGPSAPAQAQEGEARLLFERGNQHLAAGMRARGRRRQSELGEALDAYLGVLRLGGRTRNVIFNLALTVEALGRDREAFNYYSEYLDAFDLGADERAEGERRREAIRPRVAVLAIRSEPSGAEVRVDRRDLPVRGTTPLTLAVEPGERALLLSREGFEEGTARVTAALGETTRAEVTLEARPVPVQFLAPSGGALTLDGEPVPAGRSIEVAPGSHTVVLAVPHAPPVERTFEVSPGGEPMVLELTAAPASSPTRLTVRVSTPAEVRLDGLAAGSGEVVELPTLPGEHVLQVQAPGHTPLLHRFSIAAEEALALEVSLGARPDETGLDVARGVLGAVAAAALIAGGAVGLVGALESGERDEQLGARPRQELDAWADEIDALLLSADLMLGAGAALGVTTLILLLVGPGDGEPSTVDVALGASPDGGALRARGRF